MFRKQFVEVNETAVSKILKKVRRNATVRNLPVWGELTKSLVG